MQVLRSEDRTNIALLRESLQQKLQDIKAGYEEEQRKLRRSLDTEHNLVIEKVKQKYASMVKQLAKERAQLEQHMVEEKMSAIQFVKSKLEAHYTEIIDTARVKSAARVK
ncbi:hypothetical protein HPB51_000055 [Rhipicephalus microplus]|uniref:Uncharacterized protein n=1 Tax=Rhipicephalus microplus TaxID=6941 RepID=A0A9J6EED2_RHIMP|nr:hypothetical protein HPB51_000055 [Rhipicephalus microplus]